MRQLIKVVVVADSLALPRPNSAGLVRYEDTYPVLLQRDLRVACPAAEVLVAERGERFRTMPSVVEDWMEVVEYRRPDIVIVHVGIVDCAPRVFTEKERRWLERLRPAGLRRRLLALVHRIRRHIIGLRKPIVYTGLADFEAACQQLIEKARRSCVRHLIVVNILRPTESLESRSPGYVQNCRAYNAVLDRLFRTDFATLLDFDQLVQTEGGTEFLTVDGMHPNAEGHALLSRALCEAATAKMREGATLC